MPEVTVAPDAPVDTIADEPDDKCAVCPHSSAVHDQIAARFCVATDANGFDRGCVCTP